MAHYPMFDNPKFDGKRKVPDFTNPNYKGANMPHFDGPDYKPENDHARLTLMMVQMANLMRDGEWRTIPEIKESIKKKNGSRYMETSVSAGLRDFEKAKFGGHIKDKRHRGDPKNGLYEYKITLVEA